MSYATRFAQLLAPYFSRVCTTAVFRGPMTQLLDYLHFITGQGSGSGWDRKSEYSSAIKSLREIDSSDPIVIIDVGANNGSWSHGLLEHLSGRSVRCIAAECAPIPLERLREKSGPEIEIIAEAVGREEGTADLFCQTVGGGLASLHERRDSLRDRSDWELVEVPVTTLEAIADKRDINRIDFLKMDVEGAELDVLAGGGPLISKKQIAAIQFEFGSANLNSKTYFKDFWDFLSPNYNIYRICPGGREWPIRSYNERLEYFRGATNFIARLR